MDFREKTGISFGPIEAYARHHLRIAPIIGTSIRLSLQEARTTPASPSQLRSLIDGATLTLQELRGLLPSLQSVTWSYHVVVDSVVHELTTVSDGICVTLAVDDALNASTRLALEGSLRGIAARLVVALEYGD
ncbi:hypothetical protein PQR37_19470 [Paraburkholderia nemoris]|uniref:Uncharacterized protein n=2 Tax=Paraburkholderia aspalathi TaxID=1324617 RepID=A0ABM8T8M4_9BURK|nr:hypothetical protein [Paraburkholderia aspalathi]MBK3836104.1 hypothetical protein [Paraburkholderia aspalathi]CAE6869197.1 hypothetical protein R69658_08045 [Paraburkholderia aspalathi]